MYKLKIETYDNIDTTLYILTNSDTLLYYTHLILNQNKFEFKIGTYKFAIHKEMINYLINENYFELISAVNREYKKGFQYTDYYLSLTPKALLSAM